MKLKDIAAVKQAQEYIEQHLGEEVSIQTLCKMFDINREKLQNLFKGLLGVTVHGYIVQQKIYYSAELLVKTDDSAAKIASLLGYTKAGFYKQFKLEYGCTPDEFRQKNRIPATVTPIRSRQSLT